MSWHVRSYSQTFQSREKHPLQKQPFQKTASSYQDRCLSPSLLTLLSASVAGSVLTVSLLLYCCDLSSLHAFLRYSSDREMVLSFAEIYAMFSFSDWDHSEIWPHPCQIWQVIAAQNQCCPVRNRALGVSHFTLVPAPAPLLALCSQA